MVEQAGQIWIIDEKSGEREKQPFLDIRSIVSRQGNEEGLLGLAFSPDFKKSGRDYVNFTDKEKQTQIVRFTSDDRKTTGPSTAEVLLKYPSEFNNHNGGWLGFGPDNMLYIANGDGGSSNLFADYQNPRIWSFELKRGKPTGFKDHTKELQPKDGRINLISSFAEDLDGNVFIVDHTGTIYRVVDR